MSNTFDIRRAKMNATAYTAKYLPAIILARSEALSDVSDKVSDASETMKGFTVGVPDLSGIRVVHALIASDAAEKASDTSDKVSVRSDKASDRAVIVKKRENTALITSKKHSE